MKPKGSLFTVQLKLIRAQKHLDEVLAILKGCAYGNCYFIPELDEETQCIFLSARLPSPPPELSVVAGDFLFAVRSALDHLVWQLVISNGAAPTDRNMFPITRSPDDFKRDVAKGRRLDGVSAQAQGIIEGLQPYHTGTNPLGRLTELHNVDKHRTLNLTPVVASSTTLAWERDGEIVLHTHIGDEEVRHGAYLGGVGIPQAMFPKNVKVYGHAALFIAFDDPTADELEPLRVDSVLQEILEFVRHTVVPSFQIFLD